MLEPWGARLVTPTGPSSGPLLAFKAQLYGRYADPPEEMTYMAAASGYGPTPVPTRAVTARLVPGGPAQAMPSDESLAGDEALGDRSLVGQIEAGLRDDPGPGGWSGGFANQAHWDPTRAREWRCWAQSGPTWSAHCGAEVAANDSLGLCQRHRRSLLEGDPATADDLPCLTTPAEPALRAS